MPIDIPNVDMPQSVVPNMLDIMDKQIGYEKHNLDVANEARKYNSLKQYGMGAAAGDPDHVQRLTAENPEAMNIIAGIGQTKVQTDQAKETLFKGIAARVGQMAGQMTDPAQQLATIHEGIDTALKQGVIAQANADALRSVVNRDPNRAIASLIHGNLGAAQTPLVAGQVAQREAEGREPSEARIARQRGSYGAPHTITEDLGPDPSDSTGKKRLTRTRIYNPVEAPGVVSPGGGPINEFGVPIAPTTTRPGSGSSSAPSGEPETGPASAVIKRETAKYPNLNDELTMTTAEIESNFGKTPDRKGSQYRGVYQLGDRERAMMGGSGISHGVGFMSQRKEQLAGLLGREPENWEVYLAHQQGAAGAAALINNPTASAGEVVSRVGGAPRNISGNGGNPNAPSSAFTDHWRQEYQRRAARYSGGGGAAPPAPGSTAPTSAAPGVVTAPGTRGALPIPGPASTTPSTSTAPAPEPPRIGATAPGTAAAPAAAPSPATAATARPSASGFDIGGADSIGLGASKFAGVPGKIAASRKAEGAAEAHSVGGRNPQEALDYLNDHPDEFAGKKVFWSSGIMNAGIDAKAASKALPIVEEQLNSLVGTYGSQVVLAGADQGKYSALNEKLAEIAERTGAKFGGPLPTKNVHPGKQGYQDYVTNASRLLEERRSEAEPEALSGGGIGPTPTPTTAPGAGEDATSPLLPSPHPSSTVLSGADRNPGTPIGTLTGGIPGLSPVEAEVQKRLETDPLDIKKQRDELDIVERRQKLELEQKEKEADLQHKTQERALGLEQRKAGAAEAVKGAQLEYTDVAKQAAGARRGEQNIPLIERALERFRTGSTGDIRKAATDFVTDFAGALGIEATEAQKQSAAAAIIKTGGALLGFDLVNALGAREAVQVVAQVMSIKPSTINSPGANKLIIEAIRQDFARKKDMQAFYDEWRTHADNKNPETYLNAAVEFEKRHPVSQHASKVTPFPLPVTDDHKVDTSRLEPGVIYEVGGIMKKRGTDEKLPAGAQWKWTGKGWEDAGKAKEYR